MSISNINTLSLFVPTVNQDMLSQADRATYLLHRLRQLDIAAIMLEPPVDDDLVSDLVNISIPKDTQLSLQQKFAFFLRLGAQLKGSQRHPEALKVEIEEKLNALNNMMSLDGYEALSILIRNVLPPGIHPASSPALSYIYEQIMPLGNLTFQNIADQFDRYRDSYESRCHQFPDALWRAAFSLYPLHSIDKIADGIGINPNTVRNKFIFLHTFFNSALYVSSNTTHIHTDPLQAIREKFCAYRNGYQQHIFRSSVPNILWREVFLLRRCYPISKIARTLSVTARTVNNKFKLFSKTSLQVT